MNTPHVITDRRPSFQHIAVATLVLVVLVALLVPWSISRAGDAASGVAALTESEQIQGCKSVANAAKGDVATELAVLQNRGLRAVAAGDKAELSRIAELSIDAERRLVEAQETYNRAVRESIDNPKRFMGECLP